MSKRARTIATTTRQIKAALQTAAKFASTDRRALSAAYDSARDRVDIELSDGVRLSLPRPYLQGLADASPSDLASIELLGRGSGLHWPRLDVQHYVPGLLDQVFGTTRWMAHLGRRGGTSTSPAKAAAARANGRKGGRPRRRRTA